MSHPTLSIIIPAYNEARRLPATFAALREYLGKQFFSHEVIIIDDGSHDDTSALARRLAKGQPEIRVVQSQYNRGKGAALRDGVMRANGDYVLITDADLSTPLSEISKLIKRVSRDGYDAAIGSRALPESVVAPQPLYRHILGRAGNTLIQLVLGLPYHDTQCGFKLFRRDAALRLFGPLTRPRFSFDFEILLRAKKFGLRVAEVGVRWRHSALSTVRMRDVGECLLDVFRIRLAMDERGHLRPLRELPVLRFIGVGIVNTTIDACFYIMLTRSELVPTLFNEPVAAKFIAFLVATAGSFVLNRYWTFGLRGLPTLTEAGRFYMATSAGLLANVVVMFTLVHLLHTPDLVALAITTLLTFALNYTLSRRFVFGHTPAPTPAPHTL